jgi:hypothetical protein
LKEGLFAMHKLTDADMAALYVLAADWHSGMTSRGYRLLSRLPNLLLNRGLAFEHETVRESPEYARWQPMAQSLF